MSTATPEKAAAPQLEKKPVKFSNLLLGAGLNMFEVTTLGQVNTPTCLLLHWLLWFDLGLGYSKQNNHHHHHPATTATAVESLPSQ
jgi:hypothetical protein